MNLPNRRPLPRTFWFRIVGVPLVLAVLLHRLDYQTIAIALKTLSTGDLILPMIIFLLGMAVRTFRWYYQLTKLNIHFSTIPMIRGFGLGILVGALTPLRLGEFIRIAPLSPSAASSSRALAAGAVVVERFNDLFIVLFVLAFGALLDGFVLPALIISLPCLALAVLLLWPGTQGAALFRGPAPLRRILDPLLRARATMAIGPRLLFIGLSLSAYALNMCGGLLIYRAFAPIQAEAFFFRIPLITLINILPISVGGIGVRELTAMEVFGTLGYPPSSAALAATMLFVGANILPSALLWLGASLLASMNVRFSSP